MIETRKLDKEQEFYQAFNKLSKGEQSILRLRFFRAFSDVALLLPPGTNYRKSDYGKIEKITKSQRALFEINSLSTNTGAFGGTLTFTTEGEPDKGEIPVHISDIYALAAAEDRTDDCGVFNKEKENIISTILALIPKN